MINRIKNHRHAILGAIFGLAAFLLIFGLEPLRYTGTGWTMHGYDGNDITQHQTGWMFFRNSPWTFPLGKVLNLGYPEGVSISYTDSIPIVAIFFKLISPLLPETFQYFGLYTLLSFMLQGALAAELVYLFTKNHLYAALCSLLFVFSTPLIERSFRHTALSSHWLLLAAMLLYFAKKKQPGKTKWLIWEIALCCLSLGIHPYLFIMVIAVCVVSELSSKQNTLVILLIRIGVLSMTCFLFGFCIGVFGEKVEPYYGFGEFSLNINAIINSYTRYHPDWSLFTTPLPIYGGQGDGSYYFGVTALIALAIVLSFRGSENLGKKQIGRYWDYIALLAAMTVFALSNVVTLNKNILFTYNIPGFLFKLCNVFRASGRFFLIPYYSLFLLLCVLAYKVFKNKLGSLIFITVVALFQIVDIMPGIKDIREYWSTRYSDYELASIWNDIAAQYDEIRTFDCNGDRALAYWIAKKGLKTNVMITAPIHQHNYWSRTEKERIQLKDDLASGKKLDTNTAYFISTETGTNRMFESEDELNEFVNLITDNYDGQANVEFVTDWIKNYWAVLPVN